MNKFAVVDADGTIAQINEAVTSETLEVFNARLSAGQQAIVCGSEVGLRHIYKDGQFTLPNKLTVLGPTFGIINQIISLTVKWQDWQGNDLITEKNSIFVNVTGPAQPTAFTLAPVNGQAEFDLVFPVAGVYKIEASADFPCDAGVLEVTVSD